MPNRLFFTPVKRHSTTYLLMILTLVCAQITGWAQSQSGKQYTSTTNDLNERSRIEIDPSSLGLNISISLAGFPGRGASLPITLRYSSKIWRIRYNTTLSLQDKKLSEIRSTLQA